MRFTIFHVLCATAAISAFSVKMLVVGPDVDSTRRYAKRQTTPLAMLIRLGSELQSRESRHLMVRRSVT